MISNNKLKKPIHATFIDIYFSGTDAEAEAIDDKAADDPTSNTSADAILRDFRYQIQCQLMNKQRDLKVRILARLFIL